MKTIRLAPIILILALAGCSRGFEQIEYGKDVCADCKMTIVDNRFAAEVVNSKGKVFKFDDLQCLKSFMVAQQLNGKEMFFVEDYLDKEAGALNAATAVYLKHDFFKSPMNGNYAAFKDANDAGALKDSLGIEIINWNKLN